MLSHLVQNLSPTKNPSFQEDLMLYCLGLKYAPSGFTEEDEVKYLKTNVFVTQRGSVILS
jgi:hypothetical protein